MLDNLLVELQSQLENGVDPKQIEEWRHSPFLEENELAQVAYALIAERNGLKPLKLQLSPLESGAVPLFRRGFFPWGALPYPKEHAQLGALLVQLEDPEAKKIATQMARFQDATLAHDQKPIYSLFAQENAAMRRPLEEANAAFFEALALTPSHTLRFADHDLGLVSWKSPTATVMCTGSGCKSGLGTFLQSDAGILNFGPQLLPLGNCEGFGLAGRAQKMNLGVSEENFSLSYTCRIGAPHSRETGYGHLKDSSYSAMWIEAEIEGSINRLSFRGRIETFQPIDKVLFTFFGKGSACLVSGTHKLKPASLDRYVGPPEPLIFSGTDSGVYLGALPTAARMEVIPLAGGENFWGADFLVAYTLSSPEVAFTLKKSG